MAPFRRAKPVMLVQATRWLCATLLEPADCRLVPTCTAVFQSEAGLSLPSAGSDGGWRGAAPVGKRDWREGLMALLDDLRGKGGSVLEDDDSRVEPVPFDALALDGGLESVTIETGNEDDPSPAAGARQIAPAGA